MSLADGSSRNRRFSIVPFAFPWQIGKILDQYRGIGNPSMKLGVAIGFDLGLLAAAVILDPALKEMVEPVVVELSRKGKPSGICVQARNARN